MMFNPVDVARLCGPSLANLLLVSLMAGAIAGHAHAAPAASTLRDHPYVGSAESVSIHAMRLPRMHGNKVVAPQGILAVGHSLEVIRVDARTIATQVVDLKAGTNLAIKSLVDKTMSPSVSGSRVALPVTWANPLPALAGLAARRLVIFPEHKVVWHDNEI